MQYVKGYLTAENPAGLVRHVAEFPDGRLTMTTYEHPEDSQAALGAYTIGVLQLEQLARPRSAARHFAQALELGIATGLRESCYLRWAEALRQAGDSDALRGIAREYLRSFPLGEQRDAMQRLLEPSGRSDSEPLAPGGSSK